MKKCIQILLKDIEEKLNKWNDVTPLWMETPHLTYSFPVLQSPLELISSRKPSLTLSAGFRDCWSVLLQLLCLSTLACCHLIVSISFPREVSSLKAEVESSCCSSIIL